MPLSEDVVTVMPLSTGRPTARLEPEPTTSIGICRSAQPAIMNWSSQSAAGFCNSLKARSPSGRSFRRFRRGSARIEREDLAGVQEPMGIEHALDAHLHGEIGARELHAHEVALLDADAVLAGEAAAGRDAHLQDLRPGELGAARLVLVVAVIEDQGMQVAVAGVEDVGDLETLRGADVRDLGEHIGETRERNDAVHAVVVGDAAHGAEGGLAPFPDAR